MKKQINYMIELREEKTKTFKTLSLGVNNRFNYKKVLELYKEIKTMYYKHNIYVNKMIDGVHTKTIYSREVF